MKKTLITLAAAALIAAPANASEYYTNEIRVEHEDGTRYSLFVTPRGHRLDTHGVHGSVRYSLYTIRNENNTPYFLDEKTVSSYHPQASIRITTGDPYAAIPRTRVDQPFSVEYTVSGIVTDDPSVQEAAKSVVFDRSYVSYGTGPNAVSANSYSPWRIYEHFAVTQNSTFNIRNIYTVIQSSTGNSLDTRGEEAFSIYANPDWGISQRAGLLAKERVQIWPVAKGRISGIDTNTVYSKVPSISIELTDLYPKSTTYLRVYKGAPSASPSRVIRIHSSTVSLDQAIPGNRTFAQDELDTKIPTNGKYTLELIHETPFGADLLTQVYPLTVKRAININGNVNSSE